jgi:D-glycero-alpha-D-manno-heptose-7-phosphate kinase
VIEDVKSIDDIKHPSIKAVLKWAGMEDGLEIHHDGDLPARSGLGSSSSFTVGLAHAVQALKGQLSSKEQLAQDAIYIEQKLIGEHVGSQDQVSAAFGGFNYIEFKRDGSFDLVPITLAPHRLTELNSYLMLFFTGVSRIASDVARSKIQNLSNRESELVAIREMVDEAIAILHGDSEPIESFGKLMHRSWQLKRSLSDKVSNPYIDAIYQAALDSGAIGGKLLGAGGGGFMLLFARPDSQPRIRETLKELVYVPFNFEDSGSRVVLYQPNGF